MAENEQSFTLFDLPSKGRRAGWSPNTLKTRLVLNYKNVPYTTTWLEYPSIAPHLTSLGVPPNPSDSGIATAYSVPTVRFLDGTYIMDSKKIAAALEERYPEPPLHLDAPQLAKVEELLPALVGALRGITMPKIPRTLLNDESFDYFNDTRAKRFGMPLDQLEKALGGEKGWEQAKPTIEKVGKLLTENTAGPFIMGDKVSYADFILLGPLQLFKRLGGGIYERAVEMEPALGKLYEAAEEWLAKDD